MITAEQALAKVRDQAEAIRNNEAATIGAVSVGDVVRQGDLYLVCITGLVDLKQLKATKERRLAPGNTQGSRHVVKGKCKVYGSNVAVAAAVMRAAKTEVPAILVGPTIEAKGPIEIDHPEHGNRILPGAEVYAVVYQRAFADEIRRQQD